MLLTPTATTMGASQSKERIRLSKEEVDMDTDGTLFKTIAQVWGTAPVPYTGAFEKGKWRKEDKPEWAKSMVDQ